MEKKLFLTIGIASYNYGKYLSRAFEQIKKQQFRDFELLYCDDGSSDDSVSIIESIIRENPDMNIRLIKGEREGILANRNRIVENAKGEYLLICDADDYMSEDMLQKLCSTAKQTNADCVIGGFCEMDEKGKLIKVHIPSQNANPWIFIWHHAQIYKMDLVREHNLSFCTIPDDVCYMQRIHLYAKKISFVSENLYFWVRHADSTSRDIVNNSSWHPNLLWKNIVQCMIQLQEESTDDRSKWQIRYFLYKWYYFNATDEPINNRKIMRDNLKELRVDMKKIFPDYRKWLILYRTLREEDALFSKLAVLACWMAEGVGCIWLLPRLRSAQLHKRKTF